MPKNLLRFDDFNVAEVERGYGTEAFLAPEGEYETVLDTDAMRFGGFGNIDDKVRHFTAPRPALPSRGQRVAAPLPAGAHRPGAPPGPPQAQSAPQETLRRITTTQSPHRGAKGA